MAVAVAAIGCTQSLPQGGSSPTNSATVLTETGSPVANPKSSSNFSAAQLQQSFADEAQLLQQIQLEISSDRCTSDNQCTTIPIGEKACGGPERWLSCTRESAKKPALAPLLAQLITLQKQRNARSGMLSDCQISPEPQAMCRANRCVLRPLDGAT